MQCKYGKKSVTSLELRKRRVKLHNGNKVWNGDISKTVGKSKSVIHSILRKLEETGSCETKKPSGRRRKPTAMENKWIDNQSKKDRFAIATAISKRANGNLGINISRHSISRRLYEINLYNRVASTKPYISKKNKTSQLKFATEHVIWTEEQRDCIHFSDESKVNLFGCDGRRFVPCSPKERYSPQCTKSSVKFGEGSVMVFGKTRPLVRQHGKINVTVYKVILKKYIVPKN